METLAELTERALALPTEHRLALAQNLWASLEDSDLPGFTEEALREELQLRLRDDPDATWKNHEEVREEARREFGWKEK